MMQDHTLMGIHEVNLRVPNKKALYTVLMRNGYILPEFKQPIITLKFLRLVRKKRCWCINSEEGITVKPCADTPSKKELALILCQVMTNYRSIGEPYDSGLKRTAKAIKRRPPNVDWMLMVLATIHAENAVFDRTYVHVKSNTLPTDVSQMVMVDNSDNFFTDLPIVVGASGNRGVSFLSKSQVKKARLKKMRFKLDKMQ